MKTTHKPILFSTEMIKAILEGRKTQTRRIVKPQPKEGIITTAFDFKKGYYSSKIKIENNPDRFEITELFKPKYQIGDILWVREKFEYFGATWSSHDDDLEMCGLVIFNYYATANKDLKEITVKNGLANYAFSQIDKGWKPSIHMPKEAARIFLEVTNVRVERLADISEADAISEGVFFDKIFKKYDCYLCGTEKWHNQENIMCEDGFFDNPKESFQSLWESINGVDSWKANPWVWVYEFKQVEKPKDFLNE